MASSNTTLTSLWVEDGNTIVKTEPGMAPTQMSVTAGSDFKTDVLQYYKGAGLEPVAREAGLLDAKGELSGFQTTDSKGQIQIIQMVSPMKSPLVHKGQIVSQGNIVTNSPILLSTPKRYSTTATHPSVVHTPQGSKLVATPLDFGSPTPRQPQWGVAAKRTADFTEFEYPETKRKKEKGGKGLRHFSMKVCEKVQRKGTTSYNEVADELVQEFSDPRYMMTPTDQAYDQKNIRRRVYDALNVLMAMNIISKEKKEIKWIGLPTNSAQECTNLELEKQRRVERIKHKTQQLQELILQQIAFKNLVERNKECERNQGVPTANSAIQLPFIIVNTSKKTVIDCSISNDKYEYLFNFDNTFEIHDDIEVLKRMGMAFGLEKNACSADSLRRAVRMVPKALEPYVVELAQGSGSTSGTSGISRSILSGGGGASTSHPGTSASTSRGYPGGGGQHQEAADREVEMATAGLSRQSSLSFSQHDPDEYSPDSGSDRSSPVDV